MKEHSVIGNRHNDPRSNLWQNFSGFALMPLRMVSIYLNRFWRQHPTKQQLYGHLPPITKTIQIRRTRHAGHCRRSRDELICVVLQWTPSHGRAKVGHPARTYIQQLCEDTGCSPEDLPKAMNHRERWRERVRNIRADGTTRWDDDDPLTRFNSIVGHSGFFSFATATDPERKLAILHIKINCLVSWQKSKVNKY